MSIKKPLLLIGGGGHCKACIDVIEAQGAYEVAGIIDSADKVGQKLLGYTYIGTDDDLEKLISQYENVLITVGQIKSSEVRRSLSEKAKSFGAKFPTIISPSATISKYSKVGKGTIIMHHVILQADSKVGSFTILNNKSLIEHDCRIGDFNHISTAAVLNGGAKTEDDVFVGSNSCVLQERIIGKGAVVGAGEVVKSNVIAGETLK